MAISVTVDGVKNCGAVRLVHGTFTTATGDSSLQITISEHGLNEVFLAQANITDGGLNTPQPKITNSAGTITMLFDDTLGYSGHFALIGR